MTRAEVLRRAAAAGIVLAGGGLGAYGLADPADARGQAPMFRRAATIGKDVRVFRSEPALRPQLVTVLRRSPAAAAGPLFLAPNSGPGQRGVMIVDDAGEVVWFRPTAPQTALNFRAAMYRGKPVLTWWEGKTTKGLGVGTHVIVDDTYREILRFPAGRGRAADLHELLLTPKGTALVTSYEKRTMDLSKLGGPKRHTVVGGIVQELELPSARVLFEWHSLDEVALEESHQKIGPEFDYFHVNSIDLDTDGNYLVSARNTWALYKISRQTGKILWRLGGKRSDFAMGRGTRFAWQHDARHHGGEDRLVSLFDDEAAPPAGPRSRAIVLELDHRRKRATLKRSYVHSGKLLAHALGSAQQLENGDMLVGWGTEPYITEFTEGGRVVFDAKLPHGGENYRAFRLPWTGRPAQPPKLAAHNRMLYASWNGSTETASWQLRAGSAADALDPVASGPRQGFETAIAPPAGTVYAAVTALDGKGRPLATSNVVRL
jgi:hypothetical protein